MSVIKYQELMPDPFDQQAGGCRFLGAQARLRR